MVWTEDQTVLNIVWPVSIVLPNVTAIVCVHGKYVVHANGSFGSFESGWAHVRRVAISLILILRGIFQRREVANNLKFIVEGIDCVWIHIG